jgi:hypothetical protein
MDSTELHWDGYLDVWFAELFMHGGCGVSLDGLTIGFGRRGGGLAAGDEDRGKRKQ